MAKRIESRTFTARASARGKTVVAEKDKTKVIARRGVRVAVNKKRYVVAQGGLAKEGTGRRGKKVVVTKNVRNLK